ncbi:uncharacterized protein LOC144444946 [Glandiceps talaboti]
MATAVSVCTGNTSNPNSCSERCGSVSNGTYCGCDDLCLQYGDCCYDYEFQCVSNGKIDEKHDNRSSTTMLQEILNRNTSDLIECLNPGTIDSKWRLFIAGCPKSWADETIQSQCESTDFSKIMINLPVFGPNGELYKNVYCAACHGKSRQNIEFWEAQFNLDPSTTNINTSAGLASMLNTIQMITMPIYSPRNNSRFGLRTPCKYTVKSTCSRRSGEMIKKACRSYTAVVAHDITSNIFKNPHCAACNRVSVNDMLCGTKSDSDRMEVNFQTSYSMLLDFNKQSGFQVKYGETTIENHVTCDEYQVYDPFLDKCRQLSCAIGFELIDGECKRILPLPLLQEDALLNFSRLGESENNSTSNSVEVLHSVLLLEIHDNFRMNNDTSYVIWELTEHVAKALNVSSESILYPSLRKDSPSSISEEHGKTGKTQQLYMFSFSFTIQNSSVITLQESLNKLKPELTYLDFHVRLKYIMIEAKNATYDYTCNDSNYHMNPLIVHVISNNNISGGATLYSNDTDTWYHEADVHWKIIGTYPEEEQRWRLNVIVYVCGKQPEYGFLRCPLIELENNFIEVNNDSIYYEPTETLYGPGEFQRHGSSVSVCNFLSQNGTKTEKLQATFFKYSTAQTVLTLVGTLLSLVFLLISFITYCLFRNMRNLPGKTIMNLIVALFVGQVFLLFGSDQTQLRGLCAFVAMVLHYSWLVAFCWMNVMAFDICRTFKKHMRLRSDDDKRELFHRYMMYAWGAPGVIVLICIILDFCNCSKCNVGYGTGNVCWIDEPNAMIIAFMTPVGAIILANLCFFLRTVVAIWSTSKVTQQVTKKSNSSNLTTQFILYIKVSTVIQLENIHK